MSAVGLMVKALGQTPKDLGLSPSQHSNFSCSTLFAIKRIFIYLKKRSSPYPTLGTKTNNAIYNEMVNF